MQVQDRVEMLTEVLAYIKIQIKQIILDQVHLLHIFSSNSVSFPNLLNASKELYTM